MVKETITYTDYNGVERTEDFLFNLTTSELTELELTTEGGLRSSLEEIVHANDTPKLVKAFKDIIKMSYGKKSADGRRFIKSDEILEEFLQTEAYNQIFMKLLTDTNAAIQFIKTVVPPELSSVLDTETLQISEQNA